MKLAERIQDALMHAVVELDEPVLDLIQRAYAQEERKPAQAVLDAILKNLELAKETSLPMCQDTGLLLVFADVGRTCPLSLASIEASIMEGCETAVQQAYFRRSIVDEPVFDRTNTQNNLPPVIWWNLVEGSGLKIQILLKGFGSENCSSVRMLNPTGGKEAVVEAVRQIVQKAGGKPCPPIFVGVGLGGTMDRAAYLSKRALLRDVREANSDERYAALEQEILAAIQTLGIGSGGLGGSITALHVAIEQESTHIAGLPLAVSINCWADRKATIMWKEGEDA
ncbi:MAG: fumarate hydratase [Spirochaetales bacterium]|nr:fumarate hydratase [Spirochaetales bacterium]